MSEKRRSYPDDATGRVLSLMAEKGFQMDRAMMFDFHVAIPTEDAGKLVAEEAMAGGYRTKGYDSAECRLPWTCECSRVMVPTYAAVVAAEQEVDEIGQRFGGFGDGLVRSGGSGGRLGPSTSRRAPFFTRLARQPASPSPGPRAAS